MFRDGMLKSIWQDEISRSPAIDHLPRQRFDVAIAGGGITGLSCALELCERGCRCIILEGRNCGFGTTGGTTAHLNTFFDASYPDVIANFGHASALLLAQGGKLAIDIIAERVQDHPSLCSFEKKNGYIIAVDEQQAKKLEEWVIAADAVQIPMQFCDNPATWPLPHTKAAVVKGQAQFHPVAYLQHLKNKLLQYGVPIVEDCRVTGHKVKEGIVEVFTTKGNIQVHDLIYATHTPPGINLIHFRNIPWRSYVIAAVLRDGRYPQDLFYDMNDPYHYYRTQVINGQPYLIVGGEDHKTAHEQNPMHCFDRLEAHTRQHFKVKEVPYRWSSQYYEPADGLPYIGHLPGEPSGVYVATGFTGNGMIFGTLSGRVLGEIIGVGNSAYHSLFEPSRIKPVAGFSNFIRHNTAVIGDFLKDKLFVERLNAATDIPYDEGRVVTIEGETCALYRDNKGRLHAINHVCSHAGCNVRWNDAEKSWDCPCHGSRFSAHGKVLNAPAVEDLQIYDLDDGL